MLISVAIPCYRSEHTIENVVGSIKEEFKKHPEYDYQIILANDGSPDNVWEVIKKLCENDSKIVGVNLSKNFGQTSAKLAALQYVDGDILVYMDDDGQHPESGIFELVEKVKEGYDIVYAHFPQKQHSIFKKFTSFLHRKISEATKTKPKGIYISSFLAWSRFAVDSAKQYHSPFPSIGPYLHTITNKVANIDMEHRSRQQGESGYTFRKLFSMWLTYFTNFSIIPLRASVVVGMIFAAVGFIIGLIMLLRKFFGPKIVIGYTSTIVLLLFIGGVIMMILGLVGEYIGRIYMTISDMKQFSVRQVLNYEKKD